MARQIRLQFPGATYHVMARGNNREPIATDDRDIAAFVDSLACVCERHAWKVFAWCVMPNHYHLVVATIRPSLSRGMRQHNSVYAQYFNKRHGRVGHVFQGRFKALVVGKEEYLLTLLRYVQLNPCRAGLVEDPLEWTWSSARASLGVTPPQSWLATQVVWDRFAAHQRKAIALYRDFLYAGLRESAANLPITGAVIGDSESAAIVHERTRVPAESEEIPKNERTIPPLLADIFANASDTDSAIRDAYHAGYPLKTIAAHVGAHYSTISLIARRLTPRMRPSRVALRGASVRTRETSR